VLAPVNLAFLVPMFNYFESVNRDRFLIRPAAVAINRSILDRYLAYDPAESPWGNTVLIYVRHHYYGMTAIPPGLGVSFVLEHHSKDALQFPLKSRYVLMWPENAHVLADRSHLRELVAFNDLGTLYLNLDSLPDGGSRSSAGLERRAAPSGAGHA